MKWISEYFAELGKSAWEGWNRFWFTPTDPATLGLIRLLVGSIVFYTHAVWCVDLLGFFGPDGRLPVAFAQQLQGTRLAWSHLYWISSPMLLWATHLLVLLVLFLFWIGCWTRTTSILAALITISYAHRTAGVLFGLDQVSSFLLLYLAIGPSGAAYSVDRWRARRLGQPARVLPRIDANLAIRLIQLHMCLIYLVAGLGKLLGETWWAGTALWGAFANFEYQTIDMTWLAWHPLLVNLVTHTILFWEISYCVLVWPRLIRPLVLALAIPLHLGIALSMGMMSFGLVMLIGNLAFVPPAVVRNVLQGPRGSSVEQGRAGRLAAGENLR